MEQVMNIIIAAVGTSGDVHPFIGLGAALKARGHQVSFCANEHYKNVAECNGLEFVSIATQGPFYEAIANPDLWRPDSVGMRVFCSGILDPPIIPLYNFIRDHADERTVVIAGIFAFGAITAQDKIRMKLVTAHISPSSFRSAISPPRFAGMVFPNNTPSFIVHGANFLIDRLIMDPGMARSLNHFRKEMGLQRVHRIFDRWIHAPGKTIGLFPAWFCTPQSDWPPNAVVTGFPLFDRESDGLVSPEVKTFLAQGDPPIVFTPGSGVSHSRDFFKTSLAACQLIGRRAVLLTKFGDQIPAPLPAWAIQAHYIPLSNLLPMCAALVHHGGIGTTAQGLRAGVPQLVKPILHDQPDNGFRVKSLGAGDVIGHNQYIVKTVAKMLDDMLESRAVKLACTGIARKFENDISSEKFCDEIETVTI